MHLRRSFATSAATVLLTAPLLASCGFGLNTSLPYNPGTGTNNQSGSVDVLAAVVVSNSPGEGTFIATFSNKDQSQPATVESVEGQNGAAIEGGDADSIEIDPGGFVNLADDDGALGIAIAGDFDAGQTVALQITFGDGTSVQQTVPVVLDCDEYAGLDSATQSSAAASASGAPADTVSPTGAATDSGDDSFAESSGTGQESDPYACTSSPDQE